uniref:NADH-ubiquinone oxidoreductase chain 4 n=1 Tax=Dunaliella viridis TaxID=140095 RepID=A0A0C5C0L1_9CHLO|nr:NADH dehydrogenase subunit 4 [Dunaliella viridis]AJN90453.1 NADH dehydrogenase subunit 4 [Dunaliella viridis]
MLLDLLFGTDTTILAFLIVFPSAIALLYSITNYGMMRVASIIVSFIPLLWSIWLLTIYDSAGNTVQCLNYVPLIHLSFGIDAVGLSLVILTSFIFPICVILMRTLAGIVTMLLLEYVILASILSYDLFLFYITFEASLILLYLLIARPEKLTGIQYAKQTAGDYTTMDAAYKIVLYTMAGSLLFLPVIFLLYSSFGSTNLFVLTCGDNPMLSVDRQMLLGWGLLAVFAVKMPLIPVHLWLPEAHVAAPTAGSVLLAGVLLKLGGLGIIRYLIPIFPVFVVKVFPILAVTCLISFLYSTLTTLRQVDLKKIVAYSSIAHMSLVTLAIFSLSEHSITSSTYMMVAHGLVSPGLFLLVGYLYERSHTKFLPYLTGLGSHMPVYATLFFILTLANLSFPLFPNFIAEVLCLISVFAVHSLYSYVFCISQVLGAIYGFWTFNRVIHGYNSGTFNVRTSTVDLSRREVAIILPLLIGIFWLGIKPMA